MYYEVWVDLIKKDSVLKKLQEICDEVHGVFYDYHFIVRVSDEDVLKIDGVKRYRRHYDC
ncbi:hypothetical protein Asulf_01066 [Archaeoglobus sulfaticallidus PM70-1]|uniref:Uncharacterized protein n=1 Tax=Archaeoglobus sulfaticallidus PM70-1 TaxID=387631 RepID=N0BFM9_9EURY|nr:hypothetical protein [Archaeoglobus sulfaticallidus]AGK61067.1 hypothetical protein Asulf_01066 [Archaeoglobus sulfaticallidus PM70-1]